MCSDAPDTSGLNEQARASAELGKQAFDWFKQEYANTADDRAAATERSNAVSDASLAGMNFAMDQAKELDAYNKSTFRPLEQKLVTEAQNYDTPERRQQEADAAVADVNRQLAAQRLATQQELASSGVAPDSGKAEALAAMQGVAAAKAAGGAAYTARKGVEQQGYARMADAANLGRNIATTQATQQQIATSSGANSSATGQSALGSATSGAALMQTGFAQGMQGAGQAGSLFGQAAQLGQSGGADLGGLGSLLGGGAAMAKLFMSSKDTKTDKKPVDGNEVLAGMKDLNVETWRYKPGKGDGGEHIGPYAEDVQREFGDQVAPGGKGINADAMAGKVGEAVQGLDAQASRIEKKVGGRASDPVTRGLRGEDPIDQLGVAVSMVQALSKKFDKLERAVSARKGAQA